jgi:hypothetical protein
LGATYLNDNSILVNLSAAYLSTFAPRGLESPVILLILLGVNRPRLQPAYGQFWLNAHKTIITPLLSTTRSPGR